MTGVRGSGPPAADRSVSPQANATNPESRESQPAGDVTQEAHPPVSRESDPFADDSWLRPENVRNSTIPPAESVDIKLYEVLWHEARKALESVPVDEYGHRVSAEGDLVYDPTCNECRTDRALPPHTPAVTHEGETSPLVPDDLDEVRDEIERLRVFASQHSIVMCAHSVFDRECAACWGGMVFRWTDSFVRDGRPERPGSSATADERGVQK